MEWGTYRAYVPKIQGQLSQVSRSEALDEFEHAMAHKEDRVATLGRLLAGNGLPLGETDEDLDRLDSWFGTSVEADPKTASPMRLRSVWYAVSYDLGLFLGDLMIKRSPWLEWRPYLPKSKAMRSNPSFQSPVIQGFKRVGSPEFCLHPYLMVGGYGGALVNGHKSGPDGTVRKIVVSAIGMS